MKPIRGETHGISDADCVCGVKCVSGQTHTEELYGNVKQKITSLLFHIHLEQACVERNSTELWCGHSHH